MWNRYSAMRRYRRPRQEYPFERSKTFDPTVGSPSKFYRSFRTPFSKDLMWNRYSVMQRYRRQRPENPFERAITFDPTVGSPSKFYKSFRTPFSKDLMWNRYSVRRRYLRPRPEYPFERAITFDPTDDLPQNFTGVSGRRFPWSRCGIATRSREGIVARDHSTRSNSHNF